MYFACQNLICNKLAFACSYGFVAKVKYWSVTDCYVINGTANFQDARLKPSCSYDHICCLTDMKRHNYVMILLHFET